MDGTLRLAALGLLAVAVVASLAARARRKRLGWRALLIAGLAVLGWYSTIQPSEGLDWASDVKHGVTARFEDNDVILTNLRDFDWQTVDLARSLEREPQFYNTLSANCTTAVYGLALGLKSDLPIRKSLILSGRLPEYLDSLGVLGGEGSLQDRHKTALLRADARGRHPDATFSEAIRAR